MILDKLAIVGTGLIGGSFSLALKQAGAVREVLGIGRNPARLTVARELGLIDRAVDWAEAAQADHGHDVTQQFPGFEVHNGNVTRRLCPVNSHLNSNFGSPSTVQT